MILEETIVPEPLAVTPQLDVVGWVNTVTAYVLFVETVVPKTKAPVADLERLFAPFNLSTTVPEFKFPVIDPPTV